MVHIPGGVRGVSPDTFTASLLHVWGRGGGASPDTFTGKLRSAGGVHVDTRLPIK